MSTSDGRHLSIITDKLPNPITDIDDGIRIVCCGTEHTLNQLRNMTAEDFQAIWDVLLEDYNRDMLSPKVYGILCLIKLDRKFSV